MQAWDFFRFPPTIVIFFSNLHKCSKFSPLYLDLFTNQRKGTSYDHFDSYIKWQGDFSLGSYVGNF